jgi:hypothetical protein
MTGQRVVATVLIRLLAVQFGEPKRQRGQPRNLLTYLILEDAAAIFEWYTETKATRQVNRVTSEDTGSFWEFASALWRIIFRNTYGLSSAMKKWGHARVHFQERSPFLLNVDLRHPSWGIFSRKHPINPM